SGGKAGTRGRSRLRRRQRPRRASDRRRTGVRAARRRHPSPHRRAASGPRPPCGRCEGHWWRRDCRIRSCADRAARRPARPAPQRRRNRSDRRRWQRLSGSSRAFYNRARTMDTIFISELRLEALIGIYPWEHEVPQTIQLDVELAVDAARCARSGRIADTVDYSKVVARIGETITGRHFTLIERLAEELAAMILREFNTPWVRITIAKLAPLRGAK